MPPFRPFPLPVHVGTDICRISRIYGILVGPRGSRFVRRVLAREELDRLRPDSKLRGVLDGREKRFEHDEDVDASEKAPRNPDLWNAATFMAGRFAAKEAAFKAHPFRSLSFHDIIITRMSAHSAGRSSTSALPSDHGSSGAPLAIIRGESVGVPDQSAILSISHDGDYATAVCMGFVPSLMGEGSSASADDRAYEADVSDEARRRRGWEDGERNG